MALLGPEVLKVLLAFFCITKLVLKINTRAVLPTIDGRGIIALACSKTNTSSTCPRTGAKFGPRPPVAILLLLVSVLPHAVSFIAPLPSSTLSPIERGPLLSLTEVWVIRVTTPQLLARVKGSERCTHFVANTKIETALLIHGIINPRKFWEFGPIVFKGVIKETVVGMDISFQFLTAASGPVVAMKGSLHQRRHDTAHGGLIATPVALPVMLHAQHMAGLMGYYKSR